VRVRITRQPSGSIDGIQLADFRVGLTYALSTSLACYLLAERLAEPVADDHPAANTPLAPVKFRIQYDPVATSTRRRTKPWRRAARLPGPVAPPGPNRTRKRR
jgi:hypothetical protein